MNSVACFIPIKKRSTRVPQKNFRLLNNKRLFEYIIDAAIESKCFNKIYVDTDSDEVKEYCIYKNIDIINRDPNLAKDSANGNDLLNYWFDTVPVHDYYFQLFATSPFTTSTTIKECVKILKENNNYDSIFTAYKNCGWYWFEGAPINYDPSELPRSQDAKQVFNETTALYGISRTALVEYKCRIGNKPYFYFVGDIESMDIDSEFDLKIAELIAKEYYD
tara:strand:- start:2584 stop:3243 length:660 start_codon:yes stop_codon:yes gene_type:complete